MPRLHAFSSEIVSPDPITTTYIKYVIKITHLIAQFFFLKQTQG